MRSLVLARLVLPASAAAHPLDLGALHLREQDGAIEERLVATGGWWAALAGVPKQALASGELGPWLLPMFKATLATSGPEAGGRPCALEALRAEVEPPGATLVVRVRCPGRGRLTQRLGFLSALPAGYQVLVSADLGGQRTQQVLESSRASLAVEWPEAEGRPDGGAATTRGRVGRPLAVVAALAALVTGLCCWRRARAHRGGG